MSIAILIRFAITWLIPGALAILVGAKKNRMDFGIVMAILFGALGFFLGFGLGWIGFIAVCCFKRRKADTEQS